MTDLNDVADVWDLADLLEHLLRAGGVEVEAAHRHASGTHATEGEGRDVDLATTIQNTQTHTGTHKHEHNRDRGGGGREEGRARETREEKGRGRKKTWGRDGEEHPANLWAMGQNEARSKKKTPKNGERLRKDEKPPINSQGACKHMDEAEDEEAKKSI